MTGVVVDTSAAVAILLGEPDADDVLAALGQGDPRLVSAATLVELGIVLEARLGRRAPGPWGDLAPRSPSLWRFSRRSTRA